MLNQTGDGLSIGGASKPATRPTTRPFDEVYTDIRRRLMQPEIDKEIKRIHDRVASLMAKGFENHQAKSAGKTAPAVAQGVTADYATHEFLQQLAQLVQRESGILPVVTTLDETWRGPEAVDRLPGIGSASLPDANQPMIPGISMGPTVSEVLFDRAEAFRDEEQRKDPQTLGVLEPTPVFRDGQGNAYIARLTAAVGAHPPTAEERAEVSGRAEQDLRMLTAYQKALDAAKQLHEQAEREKMLQSAANTAGKRLITTGPIAMLYSPYGGRQVSVEGYTISDKSRETFATEAFSLLRGATPDRKNPIKLIELPRDGRVVVAELSRVEAMPNQGSDVNTRAADFARLETAQELASDWLDVENIRKRMNWRPQ